MSATYTPSTIVDMSKERDWPANLGMLDWDSTSIVFTKRSLIEFLKYTGTTVDTNFSNIGKLPRYAKFGKLSESSTVPAASTAGLGQTEGSVTAGDAYIPSRRVRTAPGGPQTDIFAAVPADDEGDALSHAPPREHVAQSAAPPAPAATEEAETGLNFSSGTIPTRRVRENPGGNSTLANFWDAEDPAEFKPTRRVRQGPGGHDSINDIF